jgi:hypothetical protein
MEKSGIQRRWYLSSRWVIWVASSLLSLFLCQGAAGAGALAERLAQFPNWQAKPTIPVAAADLLYPDWFAGTWQATTTLVDGVAPLAPEIITPGFQGNQRQLHQPVTFLVRFQPDSRKQGIVADRAFNGLNSAKAYLGETAVFTVKTDPRAPDRQITRLRDGSQLISLATGRATETPRADQFVTTELWQQLFRNQLQVYFNQVETTTAYTRQGNASIAADQVTAIYLSPQDPDYFKARGKPVALYRYRLQLNPVQAASEFSTLKNKEAHGSFSVSKGPHLGRDTSLEEGLK